MSLQNDAVGFASWLSLNNRRERTITKHLTLLRLLTSGISAWTKDEVDQFILNLKKEGRQNTYLNGFAFTTRLYAQYKGLAEDLQKYKPLKIGVTTKATLSDDEIEAFLGLRRQTKWAYEPHRIWTLFFSIMAFTGMRPGEVSLLKVSDVDFGRGIFHIRQSKTNTPGISPIPPNIMSILKEHIDTLKGEYLFPASRGGTSHTLGVAVVDSVDWSYMFHKRLKVLGIKRDHLTPYSLRHSFATRLLEENVSLFHVKKLMRHKDLRSTIIYEHLTTKDLIQAMEKLPLVRRGTSPENILLGLSDVVKAFHIENDDRFGYRLDLSDRSLQLAVYLK